MSQSAEITNKRLANHYITYIKDQTLLGLKGANNLDDELPHIMRVLNKCVEYDDWQAALDLYSLLDDHLLHQRNWQNRIQACEAALIAAERLARRNDYYLILEKLGATYHQLNKLDRSRHYYLQALERAQADHNYVVAHRIRENLGSANEEAVNLDAAIEQYQKALELARKKDNLLSLAHNLYELGAIYLERNQLEQAFDYLSRALKIGLKTGNVIQVSATLGYVARTYRATKEMDKAIRGCEIGLELALENDLRDTASKLFQELALTYYEMNDYSEALENFHKALRLNPDEPFFYNNLGELYLRTGKIELAKHYFIKRRDLRPFDALGANVLLGIIALIERQPETAKDYFQTALAVWEIAAKRKIQTEDTLLSNKALALSGLGRTQEAINIYKEALSYAKPEDIDFVYFDLLESFQVPLSGLTEMRRLCEEKLQQAKRGQM